MHMRFREKKPADNSRELRWNGWNERKKSIKKSILKRGRDIGERRLVSAVCILHAAQRRAGVLYTSAGAVIWLLLSHVGSSFAKNRVRRGFSRARTKDV